MCIQTGILCVNVLLQSKNLSPQRDNVIAFMLTPRAMLTILVVIFAKDDRPHGYRLRLLRQCQAKCPHRTPLPEKAATQSAAKATSRSYY